MTRQGEGPSINEMFLMRGLALGEGFALYIVSAESLDHQHRVIEKLRGTKGFEVEVLDVRSGGEALHLQIIASMTALSSHEDRSVVVVTGLDDLIDSEPTALHRLNEHRNELRHQAPGAIVLLGGPRVLQSVRHDAPDTWSVRAADLEIGPETVLQPTETDLHHLSWQLGPRFDDEFTSLHGDLHELPEGDRRGRVAIRMAEILHFMGVEPSRVRALFAQGEREVSDRWMSQLAAINGARTSLWSPPSEKGVAELTRLARGSEEATWNDLAAYAWRSAASGLRGLGRLDDALEAAERACSLSNSLPDTSERAEGYHALAEVRFTRGEFTAALDEWDHALAFENTELRPRYLERAGVTAASAGRKDLLTGYWREFTRSELNGGGHVELKGRKGALCHQIATMSSREAAAMAWDVLVELAGDSHIRALRAECLEVLGDLVISEKVIALELWERRLVGLVEGDDLVPLAMVALRARVLAGASQYQECLDTLSRFDDLVGRLLAQHPTLGHIAAAAMISTLDAESLRTEADKIMGELLRSAHRGALLDMVSRYARRVGRIDAMSDVDQLYAAAILRNLGVCEYQSLD